jgi:hypothetical protein
MLIHPAMATIAAKKSFFIVSILFKFLFCSRKSSNFAAIKTKNDEKNK